MTPFERAESLYKHAQHCGAPLEQFVLELSDSECWQVLDEIAKDPQSNINHELLKMDIEEAKSKDNPWPVMNNFTIGGFQVVRRNGELH